MKFASLTAPVVSAGNAKAKDVLDLIQYIKDTIQNLYGIKMETEVEIVGRQ